MCLVILSFDLHINNFYWFGMCANKSYALFFSIYNWIVRDRRQASIINYYKFVLLSLSCFTGLIQDIYYANFIMDRPVWCDLYRHSRLRMHALPFLIKTALARHSLGLVWEISLFKTLEFIKVSYTITPSDIMHQINVKILIFMACRLTLYVCEYLVGEKKNTYPPLNCLENVC